MFHGKLDTGQTDVEISVVFGETPVPGPCGSPALGSGGRSPDRTEPAPFLDLHRRSKAEIWTVLPPLALDRDVLQSYT